MKNTMKTYEVEYKSNRRCRKTATIDIQAKSEHKAEAAFYEQMPEAVITAIVPKNHWDKWTISELERLEYEVDRMRFCYFWGGEGNRKMRDSYEKRHSVPEIEWWEGGQHYTAEFVVDCHYSYTATHSYYTRDGEDTTLIAVRNSLKRMKQADEVARAELLEAAGN